MSKGGTPSYTTNRRLASAKASEYSIVSNFTHGYRNREDATVLPPGVLIEGSQNVLTNTFQRVGIRKGYTLDGAANTDEAPIGGGGTAMGVFDWVTSAGEERNMRAGFLTSAGNDGKLQFRYVQSDGTIVWTDLIVGLTSVNFNFVTFFDPTKLQTVLLMVNGESNIRSWAGGLTELTSGANPTGIVGFITQPEEDTPGRVSGGKNFTVGDVLNVVGGNNDAQITVTTSTGTLAAASIGTASLNTGGTNFAIGDFFTVDGASSFNSAAWCRVLTLSGSAIATFEILNPGDDYTTGTNIAVTAASGIGTGATIDINTIVSGYILSWEFASDADHGTGYSANTTYQLTGGTGTLAYIYVNTVKSGSITKAGTETWAQTGLTFQTFGTQTLLINGTTYTYDSSDFLGDTTVLYGVTPDPSSIVAGDVAIQGVTTIENAGGTTSIPTNFANQLIGVVASRLFIGSSSEAYIYISDPDTYTAWESNVNFISTSNPPTAFVNQDENLYISAGTNQWFFIEHLISSTLTTQAFAVKPVNTAALQSSQSQAMTTKIANNIAFVSFEPIVQSFGLIENFLSSPQMVDLGYSIVNLMNEYDFTGGSIFYFRKFLYIAVPRENTVLIYNMTDPKNQYWEAPQILPISRFSIIGGELYGHSSQVSETYKLFDGYADRADTGFAGYPISAKWVFSYENYGSRFSYKKCTKMYVEGYINPNTTLTANLTNELDGCKTVKTFELDGSDSQFVCVTASEGSLGKESLGKIKLGGDEVDSINGLPPKFRWFPTFSNTDFFENSVSFSVLGLNNRLDILAFGLAISGSSEIPVKNMD